MLVGDKITEDICLDDMTLFEIVKFWIDKANLEGMSKEQREALAKLLSK